MKIISPHYESEKANKVNNELQVIVDEQQYDIKCLKEYCDIYNIEPPWNKIDVCVTWNETFPTKNGLKNISRKSTLISCEIMVAKCSNKEMK